MKIGIVTGEYPPMQGGVGDYTRELARALATSGQQVSVLTDRRGNALDPGIFVSPLMGRWTFASLNRIRWWAAQEKLDLLNLQFETAAYQMSPWIHLLPRMLRPLPVVVTFHDLKVPYLFPKAGPLRERLLTLLAKSAAGSIATNADDAQTLQSRGVGRVATIPIGSNIPVRPPPGYDRAAFRESQDIPPEAFVIGYFGFLNASKGVDTLIRAVRLLQDRDLPVMIQMIGGRTGASDPANDAYASEIDVLIEQLGARVYWTGFADAATVSANLLACDVIALPFKDGVSYRRGSFMAALAHGCAIITTEPEKPLVEMLRAVELVPRDDAPALAAAIQKLYKNAFYREDLCRNAKTFASRFAWGTIAEQTVTFFKDLIQTF